MAKRFFKVVSKYKNKGIKLPRRSTRASAGYDLASAKTMVIPSIFDFTDDLDNMTIGPLSEDRRKEIKDYKPKLVPTGIKAYMQPNEVLIIANRSSNPLKRGLVVPNGIGVIDADYYNNPSNEGEIFVQMINRGPRDYVIHKGDRIAQGIFMPYLVVDNDKPVHNERLGGFGSSGK